MSEPRVGEEECRFRCEGEEWWISYAGSSCRIRETKGLRYLAALLARPGVRIPAGDLAAAARSTSSAAGASSARDPRHDFSPAKSVPSFETHARARERERLAVSRRIRAAIARIAALHPALGRHLEVTVRCGYACRYSPDPRIEIRWET